MRNAIRTIERPLANVDKILNEIGIFAKLLIDEGIIENREWYTVEFYIRKHKKDGFWVDELRISSIKRELKGEKLAGIKMPKLLLTEDKEKCNHRSGTMIREFILCKKCGHFLAGIDGKTTFSDTG